MTLLEDAPFPKERAQKGKGRRALLFKDGVYARRVALFVSFISFCSLSSYCSFPATSFKLSFRGAKLFRIPPYVPSNAFGFNFSQIIISVCSCSNAFYQLYYPPDSNL